jgi:hypothetical protein
MAWYRLRQVEAPWGECGRMLVSGISNRGDDGTLEVQRAGPFVPPIDPLWLGDIPVVTDAFRHAIEASGLRGARFREVRKVRIVRIDWRDWDTADESPGEFPLEGRPENYILGLDHDPELAERMGPLWEVWAEESPEAGHLDFARAPGFHVLSGAGVVVSERARKWLEANASEWIRTERVRSRPSSRGRQSRLSSS